MKPKQWTWKASKYPTVAKIVNSEHFHWLELESAGGYFKGIAFVVCAGISMIREARKVNPNMEVGKEDESALDILEEWLIDDSEDNYERISEILYAEKDEELIADTSYLVWWLLRSSMAHPDGCGEIEWAFESVYDGLVELGYTHKWLTNTGMQGVLARMEEK